MVTLNRPVSDGSNGAKVDHAANERIARLFNDGLTIQEIAKLEGRSWPAIQARLKRIEKAQKAAEAEAQV